MRTGKRDPYPGTGFDILHDPARNKGLAFTAAERDALGLRGLLPPSIQGQDTQVTRVMGNLRRKTSDLERYIFLVGLQDRNETLFYRVVCEHIEELMPLVYTPTVGQACEMYGHIFRRPRGLFLSAEDRGRFEEILGNWPRKDVRVIVVTDGERILGLGDLGADGMAIAVGKLVLYTACAGIHPQQCLPVTLDVGTQNGKLLDDPLYIGLRQQRIRGEAYDAMIDEFVTAAEKMFPGALIQLEDFANQNAFRLLERYQNRTCLFDDDIQGTGSVALAGLHSALRITGGTLQDQRFLLFGAGEAGIGIADLVVAALKEDGLSEAEAKARCWFVDSRGLVVEARDDLNPNKRRFAHDHAPVADPLEALEQVRPTALIGAAGTAGLFTQPMVEAVSGFCERPIVFALSNPTSKSECTARQAYEWSGGRAVFASGSPFEPVDFEDRTFVPGQANNAYIFPGVGLGVIVSGSTRVTNGMFFAASKTLAEAVSDSDLERGRVFPGLDRIREVSRAIATSVATVAYDEGLATNERPSDLEAAVADQMYEPIYPDYAT